MPHIRSLSYCDAIWEVTLHLKLSTGLHIMFRVLRGNLAQIRRGLAHFLAKQLEMNLRKTVLRYQEKMSRR